MGTTILKMKSTPMMSMTKVLTIIEIMPLTTKNSMPKRLRGPKNKAEYSNH